MIKTTTKLIPALFSTDKLKMRPSETLEELYEELLAQCMKQGGYLEKVPSEALIALQAWAFGKMSERETYNKLDKLDYILWEIV